MYQSLGLHERAVINHEKALQIMVKVFGEEHPNTATFLNSLGSACHLLGGYDKAVNYLGKALLITIKVLGEDHPHIASTIWNPHIIRKDSSTNISEMRINR